MKLILEYLNQHNGRAPPDIQRPLRSQKFDKCMDIRPLYDLACARVASYVRGKTSQELTAFL